VVESGHGGDVAGGQSGGGHDRGVGVGGVADNQHTYVVGGVPGDGTALGSEDAAVVGEKFGALGPLPARLRADEEGGVRSVEADRGVVGDLDVGEQREGGVEELHRHPVGGPDGGGDLQQPEPDGRRGAEDPARGDAEEEGVGDLSCGAGDGDGDGGVHRAITSFVGCCAR
jgi:hypothetical protein